MSPPLYEEERLSLSTFEELHRDEFVMAAVTLQYVAAEIIILEARQHTQLAIRSANDS